MSVPWNLLCRGDLAVRFGSIDGVLMHELGHILDARYGLWDKLTEVGSDAQRRAIRSELRELADQRIGDAEVTDSYRRYLRKAEEKVANAVHALLYAPELMEEIAPTVKARLTALLKSAPELAPLTELKPSLVLDENTGSVPVGGLVLKGQYWAPEAAARVLNNYLSPGLRGRSPIYDAYMGLGNVLNAAQLGLSAFHLGFTSFDAATSQVALAMKQLETAARGDLADVTPGARGRLAGQALQNLALSPLAPFTTAIRGDAVLKAYMQKGATGELGRVADAVARSGGQVRLDDMYKIGAVDRFVKAWRSPDLAKKVGGTAFNALPAALELSVKPVLEYVVPRQKLGVFARMAEYEMQKLGPEADEATVTAALQKAWDSVDNRLGQLVYDNLFWNKLVKDWAMASVRAVGWNLGTIREVAGGARDLGKAAVGKGEFTHAASYVPALVLTTMVSGAVATYLLTGEGPKELKDYFYPRTGRKDLDGNDERVQLPTYMKDVLAYQRHPLRTIEDKTHPLLNAVADMLRNRDFFGDQIRNVDDPLVQQMAQVGSYLGEQFEPFALRNVMEERRREQGTREDVLGFVGVTAAPREVVRTPAQNKLREYLAQSSPSSRTPEQSALSADRAELIRRAKRGDDIEPDLRAAINSHSMTPAQVQSIRRATHQSALVAQFKQLTAEQALKVFELANEKERALWRTILLGKLRRAHLPFPAGAARTPGKGIGMTLLDSAAHSLHGVLQSPDYQNAARDLAAAQEASPKFRSGDPVAMARQVRHGMLARALTTIRGTG